MTKHPKTKAYAVFHLNLAFSALAMEQRPNVIERCYWPLLDLVENHNIPLGIEMSSWTLAQIQETDPEWVVAFRKLLDADRCELIGSGLIQLIGPLVPVSVNRANLALGMADYQRYLGRRPRIALVNEMAYTSGLVDLYHEAGVEGLIIDWDNARLAQSDLPEQGPWYVQGPGGAALPVLWSDSILFQKFQRWVHRDIATNDYRGYLQRRLQRFPTALPLYCSDAEIFGFRPKRYSYETDSAPPDEWDRISFLFTELIGHMGLTWVLPSAALQRSESEKDRPIYHLQNAAHPILVKKQPKYNVARWAVSGQSDLHLNTLCHRAALILDGTPSPEEALQRELCQLWSSDLRTHILMKRLSQAKSRLSILLHQLGGDPVFALQETFPKLERIELDHLADVGVLQSMDPEHFLLTLRTDLWRITFNLRRGLAIQQLSFATHQFEPVLGTLPHGYFSAIPLGADFFSGHVVIEPIGLRRATDLNHARPKYFLDRENAFLVVETENRTDLGVITKRYILDLKQPKVSLFYLFPEWSIPPGTMRLGHFTLIPESYKGPLKVQCHQGGSLPETFVLDREVDQSQALSSIISCSGGLGATQGVLAIGDQHRGFTLRWNPGQGAVFPMLRHTPNQPSHLTRIIFSMAEWDETRKLGGVLPNINFTLQPYDNFANAIQ